MHCCDQVVGHLLLFWIISTGVFAALPLCSQETDAEYDFVVVGAGAGGGPVAARMAESGYSGVFLPIYPQLSK